MAGDINRRGFIKGAGVFAGAVRVMPPVMAMGQAAGTAAALCVKNGSAPRTPDATALVKALKDQGAFLG